MAFKDFLDTDCIGNMVEKGEIAHIEQFHLYPQCFPEAFFLKCVKMSIYGEKSEFIFVIHYLRLISGYRRNGGLWTCRKFHQKPKNTTQNQPTQSAQADLSRYFLQVYYTNFHWLNQYVLKCEKVSNACHIQLLFF